MQPNIILIVVDSLRADHVGMGSDGSSLTPHLDQFAAEAVVFTQAIAQGSSTPPSVKALMSSTYPYEYDGPTSQLTPDRPMLQTYLRQGGYTTAAINTNAYLAASRGWGRDYHHYDDCDLKQIYQQAILFRGVNQVTKRLGAPLAWPTDLPAETLFKQANTWLQGAPRPFFLWIHTMDVHWPYRRQHFTIQPRWQRSQRYDNKVLGPRLISDSPKFTMVEHEELLSQYRDAVRYTDAQLDIFLQGLKDRHILDDTVVIVAADHGEEFGEHGGYFHSSRLYDVLLHVPLLIRLPNSLKPVNRYYPNQVRLIDVVPTLLELADVPRPDYLRGSSLAPILRGEPDNVDRPAITEGPSRQDYALRWQGWKYMLNTQTNQAKLYSLETDPNETHSCLAENPEIVAEMGTRLNAHIQMTSLTQVSTDEKAVDDPELLERLRNLGYIE